MDTAEQTRKCLTCKSPFTPTINEEGFFNPLCDSCATASENRYAAEEKERVESGRRSEWRSTCPEAYRKTEIAKLPNPGALSTVMEWRYGEMGLLLYGGTRRGKTRCAWVLLEREFKAGRSIRALDSMAGLYYASLYSDGAGGVEEWAMDLIRADILLLDDVFKNKLTDSFEGIVFTLIDQRIQHCRPTFITTNDTGATLASRMTADRADPLLERLREHCVAINF